ncbi:unnamed protein product, partial [Prorocentrum cordatum]
MLVGVGPQPWCCDGTPSTLSQDSASVCFQAASTSLASFWTLQLAGEFGLGGTAATVLRRHSFHFLAGFRLRLVAGCVDFSSRSLLDPCSARESPVGVGPQPWCCDGTPSTFSQDSASARLQAASIPPSAPSSTPAARKGSASPGGCLALRSSLAARAAAVTGLPHRNCV